jgi:methionyl aminopeptidase
MSNMSEAGQGELFLLPRLLQEELGKCQKFQALVFANTLKATHKMTHKSQGAITNTLHHFIAPKVISKPDPDTGIYNPFPSYKYAGPLRPVYPLSPRRQVPEHIKLPDYSQTGVPRSSNLASRHKITILDKEGQDAMRKVCRLGREILDIAAREVKPGVKTDWIDEVVHKATIERDVCPHITLMAFS